jgi:hypothetical protein
VTFNTAPGSDGDGPLAANVVFTPIAGGIDIKLTNNESGTISKGQAISALSFTVVGLSNPTAFYQLTGNMVNSAYFTIGCNYRFGLLVRWRR